MKRRRSDLAKVVGVAVESCQACRGRPRKGNGDTKQQVIHGCHELAAASFEDEIKRRVWWRMVQDPKHITRQRKGNEEVFQMEAVDCDVGARNTIEVSELEPGIRGGDRRTGAAHHCD
jgi:hypothetical protein